MSSIEIVKEKLKNRRIALTLDDIDIIDSTPELQPEFILDDIMIKGGKYILYGKPKRGKTNLALYISLKLSDGKPLFGKQSIKQSVLYLTTEQSGIALAKRISTMRKNILLENGDFNLVYLQFEDRNADAINELINEYHPTLLVIDCLYNLIGETNDQKIIMKWLEIFDFLINSNKGLSVLVIHHQRKGNNNSVKSDTADEAAGSFFLTAWPNLIIKVDRENPNKKDTVVLSFECRDSKFGVEDLTIQWNREKCVFVIPNTNVEIAEERPDLDALYRAEIVKWLKDNQHKYNTATRLVEAARDNFEHRRGWKSINKYWDCWNTAKNEIEFQKWQEEHSIINK